MNLQKGSATIVVVILAVLLLGGVIYIAQTKKITAPSVDLLPTTFQELYWNSQSSCETVNGRPCQIIGCAKPYGETHQEQCEEFAWLPEENIVPSPTQSSSNIPTDWKTYRNEKYGAEFRYPPTLQQDFYPGGIGEAIGLRRLDNEMVGIIFVVSPNAKVGSLEELKDFFIQELRRASLNESDIEEFVTENGERGYSAIVSSENNQPFGFVYFSRDGRLYSFNSNFFSTTPEQVLEIAKTFRFTNP